MALGTQQKTKFKKSNKKTGKSKMTMKKMGKRK